MCGSKISLCDPLRDAQTLIDAAVNDYRNRGLSRAYATEQAALALGITPRRAKKLLYGETFNVTVEELQRIRRQFLAHLDAEAEYLSTKLATIRARHAQMELDI